MPSNSQIPPVYGVAFKIPFNVTDTAGKKVTGATFGTCKISKDFGADATTTNTPTEVGAGKYYVQATATEMQADVIGVTLPVTTASVQDALVWVFTALRRIDDLSTYAGGDTAGVTTLLARLTAARAGYLDNLNTLLDSAVSGVKAVVDAIKGKTDHLTFTLPNQVDANALTGGGGGGGGLDAAGVRAAVGLAAANLDTQLAEIEAHTGLITSGTALSIVSPLAGSTLSIRRGDTLTAHIDGLGSLAARVKLYATIKADPAGDDDSAIIQIEETTGLVRLNGAAATAPGDGALVVTDAALGNVTLTLKPAATALLAPTSGIRWDVQMVTAAGAVTTLVYGAAAVEADVTRAVS